MLALDRLGRAFAIASPLVAGGCGDAALFEAGPLAPSKQVGVHVVATLGAPLEGGTSVWCASFPLAWAELARAIRADGSLELDAAHPAVERLEECAVRADDLVPGSFFVAAGRGRDGIGEQIRQGLEQTFGDAPDEDIAIAPGAFLAYALLRSEARFRRTYRALENSIDFEGVDGASAVEGFGLDERDRGGYFPLREQVGIVFRTTDEMGRLTAWAIDLDTTNEDVEVLVAVVPRAPTLAETVAYVEAERSSSSRTPELGPNDVLRVPNVALRVTHRFAELEGVRIADGQEIDVARQDIVFRLDRTGARLTSRSRLSTFSGPMNYTFDRPFLVLMSRRGADRPFFAMWIEDAAALETAIEGR